MSEQSSCSGNCSSCKAAKESEECKMRAVLGGIKHKIVVMSGKGGVGKSTVSVNLAMALALQGCRVGILDVDVHGPSVPKMLKLERQPEMVDDKILPVSVGNLHVMSVGLLLEAPDQPVIWRGPAKIGVIRQFLTDVLWGELDYLIVDAPPGTGDEPLTVCQLLPDADGAIIVTTPQEVAALDVSKSLTFCKQLNFPVLGIVENMSGFACPHCGEVTDIFASGAGEKLSEEYGVPLLGKLPVDPAICYGGDQGTPFIHRFADTATAKAFAAIVENLMA
ncbi:MAG: Mrp/NBP35 family ATP-binding protein [Lentisphaeria bacterium]|nr:Mrp/NBP35 family ATP-binding protein [Lentisphaeria bacterium]